MKQRIWLGTFGIAEEAAKAYNQSSILMSGRIAKTNFPVSTNPSSPSQHQSNGISKLLQAKFRRYNKKPLPSVTCLQLDTENSHTGPHSVPIPMLFPNAQSTMGRLSSSDSAPRSTSSFLHLSSLFTVIRAGRPRSSSARTLTPTVSGFSSPLL
ncbi:Ethylene-responsive transcription factor SHINE 3 [Linum grandiflorum]